MSDDETSTVWSHLGGRALMGPLEGRAMEVIPLAHATWATWLDLHPDTLVLSPDTGYERMYRDVQIGQPGVPQSFQNSFVNLDDRLPENTLVVGVASGGDYRAYPLDTVAKRGGVVNDILGDAPVLVIYDQQAAFMLAYSRKVDGRVLQFNADMEEGPWLRDLEGKAIDGELKGESLTFVSSYITEWYGWSAFHPSTDIFK